MAKASTHAKRAEKWLYQAIKDLHNGDRLDAMDSAQFAIRELQASRTASVKEAEKAPA